MSGRNVSTSLSACLKHNNTDSHKLYNADSKPPCQWTYIAISNTILLTYKIQLFLHFGQGCSNFKTCPIKNYYDSQKNNHKWKCDGTIFFTTNILYFVYNCKQKSCNSEIVDKFLQQNQNNLFKHLKCNSYHYLVISRVKISVPFLA